MPDQDPEDLSSLRAPDAYEAGFMSDGAPVLQREKMTWPWYFHAMIAVVGLFHLLMPLLAGGLALWWMPLITIPLLLAVWALFAVMRVTVTSAQVHVQYGLFGPRIPIARIEHCEAETYSFWKYGGYGIRYSVLDKTWAFNMLGDKGRAVRIHYRTDSGGLRKVLVASRDPQRLVEAIRRAQGQGEALLPEEVAQEVEVAQEIEEEAR